MFKAGHIRFWQFQVPVRRFSGCGEDERRKGKPYLYTNWLVSQAAHGNVKR